MSAMSGLGLSVALVKSAINLREFWVSGYPMELAKMTVEETEAECNRVIDEFNGNSKMVLGTMGSVNQVPIPNLLKVLEVCDNRKI